MKKSERINEKKNIILILKDGLCPSPVYHFSIITLIQLEKEEDVSYS
jgi:hypothetical protein